MKLETVFFLKTYIADLGRARQLIRSYHDTGQCCKFYICCKKYEFDLLKNAVNCTGLIFIDEVELLTTIELTLPGYLQQQLIKLRVYYILDDANFFILDSDSVFLKRFQKSDFISGGGSLLSFVDFNLDVEIMRDWTKRYGANRERYMSSICEFYQIGKFPTAHGITNLVTLYLREMVELFQRRGSSLKMLIQSAPLEFSWYFGYCEYADLRLQLAPKPFYTFHTAKQYENIRSQLDLSAFKEIYFGYVLNSNWADAYGVKSLDDRLCYLSLFQNKIRKISGASSMI